MTRALTLFVAALPATLWAGDCKTPPTCASRASALEECVRCCLRDCRPAHISDCVEDCEATFPAPSGSEESGCGHSEGPATAPCVELPDFFVPVRELTVDLPRAGFVVITASGFFSTYHTGGSGLNDGYVCLSTEPGPTLPDCPGFVDYGFPSSDETGRYRFPFSVTRTFPAAAGANTWYLSGAKAGDPQNTLDVCQSQVSAVYVLHDYTR